MGAQPSSSDGEFFFRGTPILRVQDRASWATEVRGAFLCNAEDAYNSRENLRAAANPNQPRPIRRPG